MENVQTSYQATHLPIICRKNRQNGRRSADMAGNMAQKCAQTRATPFQNTIFNKVPSGNRHAPKCEPKDSKGRSESPLGSETFVASGDKEKAERVSRNERPLAATIEAADAPAGAKPLLRRECFASVEARRGLSERPRYPSGCISACFDWGRPARKHPGVAISTDLL